MLVVNLLEILKMCRCGPLKGFSLRSSEILTNNLIQFINTSLMSKELLLGYIHEYKFEHHVFFILQHFAHRTSAHFQAVHLSKIKYNAAILYK